MLIPPTAEVDGWVPVVHRIQGGDDGYACSWGQAGLRPAHTAFIHIQAYTQCIHSYLGPFTAFLQISAWFKYEEGENHLRQFLTVLRTRFYLTIIRIQHFRKSLDPGRDFEPQNAAFCQQIFLLFLDFCMINNVYCFKKNHSVLRMRKSKENAKKEIQ